MNRFRKRWFQSHVERAMGVMPVTVLTGPRQTGKTTLARAIEPSATYHTLDDLGVLDQALEDPASLTQDPPVIIDEVQRAPRLVLAVKHAVDQSRMRGAFLLTKSANLLLLKSVADSLAGRAIYLQLPPFCPTEWMGDKDRLHALDRLFDKDFDFREWPAGTGNWPLWLLRGGFPPALEIPDESDRSLWMGAYVQTYLERDLRQLTEVSSLPDFQRVMLLAAQRTGRLLNQAELARDAAMTQPTTHRYLNLLEAGCLLTKLRPLTSNPASALIKTPRIYWSDCGLAAWLAGIRSSEGAKSRIDSGFWLEQTLFQSFQSWQALDPQARRLHFWRDRAGREVDFVLEKDGQFVALEIKSAKQVKPSDASGIEALRASMKNNGLLVRGAVLHGGSDARRLSHHDLALPWGWMVPEERGK
jgi:predicted AAA+ superfamily ATPase